jgi:hypothetical protein
MSLEKSFERLSPLIKAWSDLSPEKRGEYLTQQVKRLKRTEHNIDAPLPGYWPTIQDEILL